MNIVGIGSAGCRISNYLAKHEVYETYQIDVEDSGYKNFIPVVKRASHEEYENTYKELDVSNISGPTTVILSGAGKISGIVLRVLQQLNENSQISVLYVKPRTSEMSSLQATRHKVCNQVLQQYARSRMIERIIMIDNEKVESIIPNIEIEDFWSPINMLIAETFHMINVLTNTEPLLKSSNMVPKTAKISTFSVIDFENNKEELFYDVEHTRAKNFYLALGDEYIQNNKNLLNEVRAFTSEKQTETCDSAYAIYKTDYDQNYVYGVHHASFIQEQNLDL